MMITTALRNNPNHNVERVLSRGNVIQATLAILFVIGLGVLSPGRVAAQTFDDVATDHWAFSFIEILVVNGITGGCGNNNYCPGVNVTRAQMAVFLERGMRGSGYVPPAATGNVFSDVRNSDFAAGFIEQLFHDGITSGCGNGNYCASAQVTRAQMAVFLLRAKYGSEFTPQPATGIFADVPLGSFAVAWIERLAAEGITSGCGGENYCPNDSVTRAQMAVFLTRTFGLALPNIPPEVTSISPTDGETDVPLDDVISVSFSEDIDPSTFNASNVSVVGPLGQIIGVFDVTGANATFTPNAPLTGVSRIAVNVSTGVTDTAGAPLVSAASATFFTALEPDRWYRLTNMFRGPEQSLQIGGNGDCVMAPATLTDLWQLRPIGMKRYRAEKFGQGDRRGLEGGGINNGEPCLLTGYAGIPHGPFAGQAWRLEPTLPSVDVPPFFRLWTNTGGVLDDTNLRSEGPFTGQFWNLVPWLGIGTSGTIGESSGGQPFLLDCDNPNRVLGVDIKSGQDIDQVTVRCVRPDGTVFTAGSTGGGGGGAPVTLDCPPAAVFAGFRGRSRSGAFIDQLGIKCRAPFRAPVDIDQLQGDNDQGALVLDATCEAPWRSFGVGGRSGLLIDNVHMRCHPPEATFAETDPVGGTGGDPFAIGCPAGEAVAGLRGRAGDDIDQLRLGCVDSNLEATADSASVGGAGGDDLGNSQMCFGGEVMVGIMARTRGLGNGQVIDQLSVQCSNAIGNLLEFGQGGTLAGLEQSGDAVQRATCPAGMFVSAISGNFGALLDGITLHCSTQ